MKKTTKKPIHDNRKEWKEEMSDCIIDLQTDLDEAFEGMNLDTSILEMVEKAVKKYEQQAHSCIDLFTIDPAIAFEEKNLFENMLDDIHCDKQTAGDYEIDTMRSIVESKCKVAGQFVPVGSLAEQIKLDEFLADLQANPYQLKLIA